MQYLQLLQLIVEQQPKISIMIRRVDLAPPATRHTHIRSLTLVQMRIVALAKVRRAEDRVAHPMD